MNDRGLVDALRARDANALAELYDRYAESVYRYCWTLTGGPDGAQVALRDTMIAVEARIHALTDPARFKVWLYALARGECLRRRPVATSGADTEPGYTGLSAVARDAVDSLSPADREILELVHRHGFTLPDAARVLGVSRRQAKIRYGAAAERLFDAVAAELRGRESQVFGLLPQTVLPESLRVRVMSCFVDPDLLPYRRLVARRVGPLDASGFPVGTERRLIRGVTAGTASVAVALVVAFAFNQFWLSGGGVTAAPGGRSPADEPADVRTVPETISTGRPRAATPTPSARGHGRMPVVGIGLPTPPRPLPATSSGEQAAAVTPRGPGSADAASPRPARRGAREASPGGAGDGGGGAPAGGDAPGTASHLEDHRRHEPRGGHRADRRDDHRDDHQGGHRGARRDEHRHGRGEQPWRGGSREPGPSGHAAPDRPRASGEISGGRPTPGPRRPAVRSPVPADRVPSPESPRIQPTPGHPSRYPRGIDPGPTPGVHRDLDAPGHRSVPDPAPLPAPSPRHPDPAQAAPPAR